MLSRLLLAIALTAPLVPQQVFRSTADVVPLFVTAQDKSGRLITKLTREDFQVFDNGKPQPLTVFDNSPQPIRLIILIDVSGSMAGNLPLLGAACAEMIGALAPGDLARIGYFGNEIAISPTFTRDARELAAWLPRTVPRNQPTPLWAAVDRATTKEFGNIEGRRVVMVLTDSKDSGPQKMGQTFLSPLEIIDHANREDVMVYGIGVRSALPGPTGDLRAAMESTMPDPSLGRVADDTGGGYFELMPRDNLQATFSRVADELRQQYLLGFVPPTRDGKLHKIEVKVHQDGAKVRVRKSYQAPKASGPGS